MISEVDGDAVDAVDADAISEVDGDAVDVVDADAGMSGITVPTGAPSLFLKRIVIEIRLQPLRAHRGCFSRQCFD